MLRAAFHVVRLPSYHRRRTMEATAELTRASLELRLARPSRTISLLGVVQRGPDDTEVSPDRLREAKRVGATVEGVARRLPWQPTCLRQALAVQRMLRRRGIPSRLHVGATTTSSTVAHAWITVAGQPVAGQPSPERFVPLATFE